MPLVSSVKDQSKLPKSLLIGGQCLDRVTFFLKSFDFNDFSLKLTKYLMFPNMQPFLCKNLKSSFPRKCKPCVCNTSLPHFFLHNLVAVNQIVDKNPLKTITLLYGNKIDSQNSEQVFYSFQLKTCSELNE